MEKSEMDKTVQMCRAGAEVMERIQKSVGMLAPVVTYVSFDAYRLSGFRFHIDMPLTEQGFDMDAAREAGWEGGTKRFEIGDQRAEVIRKLTEEFGVTPRLQMKDYDRWKQPSFRDTPSAWIYFLIGDYVMLTVRNAPLPFKLESQKSKEEVWAVTASGERVSAEAAALVY